MLKKSQSIYLLFASLLLICSCQSGTEREAQKWYKAKGKAQELMAVYPSFTVIIEKELEAAQLVMNKAMAEDSRKKRKPMMSEARTMLTNGIVGLIDSIDEDTQKLRGMITQAAGAGKTERARNAMATAADKAQKALKKADDVLVNGVDDDSESQAVLEQVKSEVNSALNDLNVVLRNID